MIRLLVVYLIILLNLKIHAQDSTITIFFKSGQSKLTPAQKKEIDKLHIRPILKVTINGYADTVGKKLVNKKLSYKRAQTSAKLVKTQNKNVIGKGELHQTKVSLNKMRKVVINVWYDTLVTSLATNEVAKQTPIKINLCAEDTTIYFKSGSMIEVNKCYFEKIKSCFKYTEFDNARTLEQSGLRTIDENGDPIESGGMFSIQFCSDTCLTKPIIVFRPVLKCMSNQEMTLWTLTRSNTWKNSNNKIELINFEGKEYYKLIIYCPGTFNCDRPIAKKGNIKVKLKNGLKIKSATLSYNCPLTSFNAEIKNRKTVAVFPSNCPKEEALIKLLAYDKAGNTYIIDNKNINQFKKKRKLSSKCDCDEKPKETYIGVFKIKQKFIYKKYKLFKKDLDINNTIVNWNN